MKRCARHASTKACASTKSAAPNRAPMAGDCHALPIAMPITAPATAATTDASRRGMSQPIASRGASAGQRLHLLRQAVAGAAHGLDHARALHRVQRLAQAFHVDVDCALLDEHMVAPDAVEQLCTAVHTLRM